MPELCDRCNTPMKVITKTDNQVVCKCSICGDMKVVQVIKRDKIMAKGIRASVKQAAAGRRNLLRAQVNRIGLRGRRKREGLPKLPRSVSY